MTLLRHTPPCNDPACLPCWWDALDKEMYSRPLVESRLTGETPTTGRCRCCRHKLEDPVSLAYGIGPDCRKRLGIAPRRPVRVTGVEMWRDCEGQTDLLETSDDE